MTMKDLAQIATIIHFYNNPTGRYNRFCRFCDHLQGSNINNFYCTFFGERCHEAVRKLCPLPTAGVAMLMESESVMSSHIQASKEGRKGGTVVPPSDFQSVSTESVHAQKVTSKTPRPHGHTRAHSRKEPLAPTHFSGQLCGKTDCIYYGHRADYCEICTTDKQPVEKIYPDMCANLLFGECDGHACKCQRYVDFVDWCNKHDGECASDCYQDEKLIEEDNNDR